MGPGPEQVRRIDLEDVEVFMSLQDGFVLEHHSMTSMVYEEVSLLDWQHSLFAPGKSWRSLEVDGSKL